MKTILTAAAAAALLATVATANAQSPAPENYNALRDFSYNNPNGVWSYGYGTAGDKNTFVVYPVGLDAGCGRTEDVICDCFISSNSLVAQNVSGKLQVVNAAASSIVVPVDALQLHPRDDGQETIIVFKAPAHGFYKMEGFYEILDNAPTSIAPRIVIGTKDQTRKAFGSKVDVVLSGASDPANKKVGEKKSFSFTRELSKDQRVQFSLNPNGDWRFDSTGFDVTITPVASK